eukprot:3756151-Pyramimonas_sp.AAC.1
MDVSATGPRKRCHIRSRSRDASRSPLQRRSWQGSLQRDVVAQSSPTASDLAELRPGRNARDSTAIGPDRPDGLNQTGAATCCCLGRC